MPISTKAVAQSLYHWALTNGYLYQFPAESNSSELTIHSILPEADNDIALQTERVLSKAQITAVLYDEGTRTVTVLTKGALSLKALQGLPNETGDVSITYIGHSYLPNSLPPDIPIPIQPIKRCYIYNNLIACGSSVSAATTWGAGTMGCLVKTNDGTLCGLTNNHVTGECNHMIVGMPVLIPAPIDATPGNYAPFSIGTHRELIPLRSGNPVSVTPQEIDAAIFDIVKSEAVSSMQGDGAYDTPATIGTLGGGLRVKKIGRTTGLTTGSVLGTVTSSIPIPYETLSGRFKATVYFQSVYGIQGDGGQEFSAPGDSGALVVSEDGSQALGLVFAGMGAVSLVIPLATILSKLDLTLVSAHNVSV